MTLVQNLINKNKKMKIEKKVGATTTKKLFQTLDQKFFSVKNSATL
jgi:hypothetical protein